MLGALWERREEEAGLLRKQCQGPWAKRILPPPPSFGPANRGTITDLNCTDRAQGAGGVVTGRATGQRQRKKVLVTLEQVGERGIGAQAGESAFQSLNFIANISVVWAPVTLLIEIAY